MTERPMVLVIGECKRNPDKIKMNVLQEKAAGILAHHKGWDTTFVPLSLEKING